MKPILGFAIVVSATLGGCSHLELSDLAPDRWLGTGSDTAVATVPVVQSTLLQGLDASRDQDTAAAVELRLAEAEPEPEPRRDLERLDRLPATPELQRPSGSLRVEQGADASARKASGPSQGAGFAPTAGASAPPQSRTARPQSDASGAPGSVFAAELLSRLDLRGAAQGHDSAKGEGAEARGLLSSPTVTIVFSDDGSALSAAARDQIDELGRDLRASRQPAHVRAIADTTFREASQSRRLALRRLLVVRDYLVGLGLPKSDVTLDATTTAATGDGGDRVEISTGPTGRSGSSASSPPLIPPARVRLHDSLAANPRPELRSAVGAAPEVRPMQAEEETSTPPQMPSFMPLSVEQPPASPTPSVGKQPDAGKAGQEAMPALPSTALELEHAGKSSSQSARSSRTIQVQVSSHKRKEDALADAEQVKRRFAQLLDGHHIRIEMVELEGRGRFHRVRTGPVSSRTEAAALCRALQQQGQDCLVVNSRGPPTG